jgi:hypothetical protein
MLDVALFNRIGGFDPHYALAEDFDFLLKATQEVPVDFIDEPLLYYREHCGSGTYQKIDQITSEVFSILHIYKIKNPQIFRRHILKYIVFKAKFAFLKWKVFFKKKSSQYQQ